MCLRVPVCLCVCLCVPVRACARVRERLSASVSVCVCACKSMYGVISLDYKPSRDIPTKRIYLHTTYLNLTDKT